MRILALVPALAASFSIALLTGWSMSPPAIGPEGFNANLVRTDGQQWPNSLRRDALTTVNHAARSVKRYDQHSLILPHAKNRPLLYVSDEG
jgi:hypothetical protein